MNPALLVVLFLALNGTWAVFWVAFRHKQDVGHSRPTAAMLLLQAVFHAWIAKAALLSEGLRTLPDRSHMLGATGLPLHRAPASFGW